MVSTSFQQMDASRSSFSFRRNPSFGFSIRRNGRFSLSLRRRDYEFLEASRDDPRNAATLEMSSASVMENKNSSMAEEGGPRCRKPASFMTRMNAVFRKNLAYQAWGRIYMEIDRSQALQGTDTDLPSTYFFEAALTMLGPPLYIIQQECNPKFSFPVAIKMDGLELLKCVQGLNLWCNSSTHIAREILTGYSNGNSERRINEILAAYDFSNTGDNIFNVTFWYNGTYKDNGLLLRIPRASNVASNSYLHFFKGANVKLLLDFVKEMPKGETPHTRLNISSTISPLLLTWVILANLVNEKQSTRMFMKMLGLGDIPYWTISYAYFLLLSSVNMLFLVMLGSLIENLQISLAFLASTLFSNVKTATVSGYLYVFGSGLLGYLLFQDHHQHAYHREELLQLMEIFPGLSLYRGLHEFAEFAYRVDQFGVPQIRWKDVSKDNNRLGFILLTMIVEWPMLLLVTYYLDQVLSHGGEVKRHPLWFLTSSLKRKKTNLQQWKENDGLLNMDRPDISQEREAVERSLQGSSINCGIICDNLKKVHPSKNGNNGKHAVRGLSLALCQGECFGLLGPSGAGKTSFVNMMTGLATPTSGAAFVQGLDTVADMDKIYSSMGVCPQNNLLWDTLTGKEHLLFYGRLKNLSEDELTKEVEDMLKKTKLFDKDISDKLSSEYSGGMKRKLSVAISLIGNPKVVYMDEPTKGLDPTSRKDVWTMLQKEKHNKTIVITTCSVEETDALCDRVGIFVNGSLECLGSPRELKLRYGGFYILTTRTPSDQEDNVEKLARRLSPRAKKVFHFSGTQKFHLPKQEIRATDIFNMIGNAKKGLEVHTWGLTSTSLEDVFRSSVEGVSPTI